jgi:hypothetical protein
MRVEDVLVDRMIDLYCDWRTACAEVRSTYERFCRARSPDRALAFAAYAAALDREQSACEDYAGQIKAIVSRRSGSRDLARVREVYGC